MVVQDGRGLAELVEAMECCRDEIAPVSSAGKTATETMVASTSNPTWVSEDKDLVCIRGCVATRGTL